MRKNTDLLSASQEEERESAVTYLYKKNID